MSAPKPITKETPMGFVLKAAGAFIVGTIAVHLARTYVPYADRVLGAR
jgi:hypothetical protein